jgi:hypothetical protein
MKDKASDKSPSGKSPKATELNDGALETVVGGCIGISGTGGFSPAGPVKGPVQTGGGGDGPSPGPSDGGLGKGGASGSFEPSTIHFPK